MSKDSVDALDGLFGLFLVLEHRCPAVDVLVVAVLLDAPLRLCQSLLALNLFLEVSLWRKLFALNSLLTICY